MRIIRIILLINLVLAITGASVSYCQMNKYKQEAIAWIDSNDKMLNETATKIWGYSETALREQKSSACLADMIEKEGFSVERGVAGMPTAFVATYGNGKPVIGILAEYDALPGLSQKPAIPYKEPILQGAPGHGCGHNLFGTGSTAAAIAIKVVMEKHNLTGTVKLFGCPAEEIGVGKAYMAKEGIFNDLDACLVWHPETENKVNLGSTLAANSFELLSMEKLLMVQRTHGTEGVHSMLLS